MKQTDTKNILKLTAKLTDNRIYVVEDVIKHGQFKYLKQWFRDPDKPAILLHNLGTFEIRLTNVVRDLRYKLLPKLRDSNSPKRKFAVDKFKFLWDLKNKIYPYLKRKKRGPRNTNASNGAT